MTGSPDKNPQFLAPSSPETLCKICGWPAHGLHFGVITCRACAAFFRRFIVLNLQYKSSCRHCRFQKCLQMGMTADRVQWHRDSNLSNDETEKLKKKALCGSKRSSCSSEPGTSQSEIPSCRSILQEDPFRSIEEDVKTIFQSDVPINTRIELGPLQKFAEGLRRIRSAQKTNDVELENYFTTEILRRHWKNQARKIAFLMMHSMEFQDLEIVEKLQKFRRCWKSLYRLERILVSVEVFGEDCVAEKILIISNDQAICIDEISIDAKAIEPARMEKYLQFFMVYSNRLLEDIARPLVQMKLLLQEQAFLILVFLATYDDTVLEDSSLFWNQVFNDIHEYYMRNEMSNYAPRILKMLKIVQAMRRIHNDDICGQFTGS